MLIINLDTYEIFNESTGQIIRSKPIKVKLEHSLISMSKWEAYTKKPFISSGENADMTKDELFYYLKCMVIGDYEDHVYSVLWAYHQKSIISYMNDPYTATIIKRSTPNKPTGVRGKNKIITTEQIYYWMIGFNIPFEAERWNINRLLTLIDICNIKNKKPSKKKRLTRDQINSRRELNRQRLAELGK